MPLPIKEIEYNPGDLIFILEEECQRIRVPNRPWLIIKKKYTQKTYNTDPVLSAYTVQYGSGGHDFYLDQIDQQRTKREYYLNQILK